MSKLDNEGKRIKKSTPRKIHTEYSIWTYNSESNLEMIKLPLKLKNEFISKFGVDKLVNTSDVLNWINSKSHNDSLIID